MHVFAVVKVVLKAQVHGALADAVLGELEAGELLLLLAGELSPCLHLNIAVIMHQSIISIAFSWCRVRVMVRMVSPIIMQR